MKVTGLSLISEVLKESGEKRVSERTKNKAEGR